jgi:hypothetical protein
MSDRFIATARFLLLLALMLCGSRAFATVSTLQFLPVAPVEGQPFTAQIATFIDDSGVGTTSTLSMTYGPSAGGGTTISGTNGSSGFTITLTSAANTYLVSVSNVAPFTFTGLGKISLTVTDNGGTGIATVSGTSSTFTVVPLLVTGNTSLTGTTTLAMGTQIAAFSDYTVPDPGTLTASINWGDGSPPDTTPVLSGPVTVTGPPEYNTYTYLADVAHTFPALGVYNIVTTITDSGGGGGSVINTLQYTAAVGSTVSIVSSSPLVGSDPTSTFGDLVTFTATVVAADGSPVTGSVEFYDNVTPIGSATITTATTVVGSVTTYTNTTAFATNALTFGTHTINATYSGDPTHISSTTTLANGQTVNSAAISLLNLSASLNPVLTTLPVTFTATVISGNSSTPNGFVTFYDSDTQLSVVQAIGTGSTSTAQYTTFILSAGSHDIRATYTGDTNAPPLASSATYNSIEELVTDGAAPSSSGDSSRCGHGLGVSILSLGLLMALRSSAFRRR